jgi:hypothetical protein
VQSGDNENYCPLVEMQCNSERVWCFGGKFRFHLQGRKVSQTSIASGSDVKILCYSSCPWL